MTISPGSYIRMRRIAAGMSIDDLALILETVPAVSARSRGEWLREIEADTAELSIAVSLVLRDVIGFDWHVLFTLSVIHAGLAGNPPRLCRVCACSERDPCELPGRDTCAWAAEDLCTACVDPQPAAIAA